MAGIRDIIPYVIIFGVAVLITSVVADIVSEVNADQTADSYADNISTNGLQGLAQMGSFYDVLGLVLIASIVIGVLIGSFMFSKM